MNEGMNVVIIKKKRDSQRNGESEKGKKNQVVGRDDTRRT